MKIACSPAGDLPDVVSEVLRQVNEGVSGATDRLVELLYDELHRIAARHLRKQRPGHTLQATALIGEAYARIFDRDKHGRGKPFQDPGHFLRLASRVMRLVLVDYARRHRDRPAAVKLPLDSLMELYEGTKDDLLALNQALEALEKVDPPVAQIVELHYFGDVPQKRVAEILGMSLRTVERDLEFARAWLARWLSS